MITVLFVDDEPKVLRGVQRQIDMVTDDWQVVLASGGAEALAVLNRQDIDVIITDMRMPGMDGISLLAKVARQYPHIVRLILTGYANATDALRAANFAHQFLAKPIDTDVLVDIVQNTIKLRDMLNSCELRQVVGEIDTLPSVPSLYTQLMQAL
ncbi:MAG TPA: response regulator, partial [Anaerolineae bacterium]|nr:response regulator [Anaerolineae bacterium]